MKRKNAILVIGLMIFCLIFSYSCKSVNGPSNGDDDDDNGNGNGRTTFVFDVKMEYERLEPYDSNDYVDSNVRLNVFAYEQVNGWYDIRNETMEKEKESNKLFKYTVKEFPVGKILYTHVQDYGISGAGGPQFNGRIIRVNGIEITDVRGESAYFTMKADGTIEVVYLSALLNSVQHCLSLC